MSTALSPSANTRGDRSGHRHGSNGHPLHARLHHSARSNSNLNSVSGPAESPNATRASIPMRHTKVHAHTLPLAAAAAPSPFSDNTSLGNGSPSVRGAATETKPRLYETPRGSPVRTGATCPNAASRALERELLLAPRGELVHLLIELCGCNADAARFIQSKAQLLAMRHALPHGSECPRPQRPEDRSCNSANATPSKLLAFEDEDACATPPAPGPAESRAFCAAHHPCLRLYGACRHPTRCLFAACPQNLCLHWIRGVCVTGSCCSGVHRLPEDCPEALRTLFELNHGADRLAVAQRQRRRHNISERSPLRAQAQALALAAAEWTSALVTPVRQILTDPVSVPGSLEHCNEFRQPPWASRSSKSSGAECVCRVCGSPGPVPRCLNESFADAAEEAEGPPSSQVHTRTQSPINL